MDQERALREASKAAGLTVKGRFSEYAAGWSPQDQEALASAFARARSLGACVLAESTDRYLRHPDYKDTKTLWPTADQFEGLLARAAGVLLATVIDPNAPHEEVRQYQQKRGLLYKRPHRYQPRHHEARAMAQLRAALRAGVTAKRAVARLCNRPESTVRGWIAEWEDLYEMPWPKGVREKL